MNIYTLINDLVTAVAQDSELIAWTQVHYGQKQNVYLDQDERYPPGESDAPDVQFHSPSKSADEENRIVEYGVGVYVVIYDAATETRAEDNVEEFTATGKLAEFINRILTVIRAAKPADFVMGFDWMTDTITSFPNFEADVAIGFRERMLIGMDPLA